MKTKFHINTLLAGILFMGLAACTDEEMPQTTSGLTGQLHIGSVKVGDSQVAGRAIAEGQAKASETFPYNQAITGFSNGDKLSLTYNFQTTGDGTTVEVTYNGSDGTWGLTGEPIKPGTDEKWENLSASATFLPVTGNGFISDFTNDNYVTSFTTENVATRAYYDKLEASTTTTEGAGSIIATTDLNSKDLGKLTIYFGHAHALLRLPYTDGENGAIDIHTINQGTVISGRDKLATLWAELEKQGEEMEETIYVPLTPVSIDNEEYRQAIVPVDYTLTGFKAVLKESESSNITIDLPFDENAPKTLTANNQYNLTLTIAKQNKVDFQVNSKPQWGDSETTLQDWKVTAKEQLSYSNGTFSVSGPLGLLLLNQWMTGTGDEINGINGYTNIAKTAPRLSHNITITNDITFEEEHKIYDLDGQDGYDSNWKPLGGEGNPYTGTFDGGSNTITGLSIITSNGEAGLVDRLAETGTIKGLTLSNVTVQTGYNYTGIVAGYSAGMIEKVTITGDSSVKGIDGGNYVGGIVGYNTGTIMACMNNGASVEANGSDSEGKYAGGIAGKNSGILVACGTSSSVDKIVGFNTPENYQVYGCWTKSNETKLFTEQNNYIECYYLNDSASDDETKAMNNAIAVYNNNREPDCNYSWEVVSSSYPELAQTIPTISYHAKYTENKGFEVYTAEGLLELNKWIFNNGYTENSIKGELPNDKSVGDKADNNERATINITLKDDIVLDNSNPNWYFEDHYKGVFDGAGHTIENLYVNPTGDNNSLSGMFDQLQKQEGKEESGIVRNLTLKNPIVVETYADSGIIVCANGGTVKNCHVIGGKLTGRLAGIGGIVGNNSGTVESCTVSALTIERIGDFVESYQWAACGSIVGQNIGTITNCTATNVKLPATTDSKVYSGTIVGKSAANSVDSSTASGCTIGNNINDLKIGTN